MQLDKRGFLVLKSCYLALVGGGRWQVSRGISRGVHKLAQTPWLFKKRLNFLFYAFNSFIFSFYFAFQFTQCAKPERFMLVS